MIRFLVAPLAALAPAACGSADTTPNDAAGRDGVWKKGDLHLLSHHSQDALDNPMADLVDIAEARPPRGSMWRNAAPRPSARPSRATAPASATLRAPSA